MVVQGGGGGVPHGAAELDSAQRWMQRDIAGKDDERKTSALGIGAAQASRGVLVGKAG